MENNGAMDEKFCGNVVHLRVSSLWKAKFRTRSLHEKKVCVFLFLNCLHPPPPDQLLPAGFSRRPGGGEEEKGRKREQKVAAKEGGE